MKNAFSTWTFAHAVLSRHCPRKRGGCALPLLHRIMPAQRLATIVFRYGLQCIRSHVVNHRRLGETRTIILQSTGTAGTIGSVRSGNVRIPAPDAANNGAVSVFTLFHALQSNMEWISYLTKIVKPRKGRSRKNGMSRVGMEQKVIDLVHGFTIIDKSTQGNSGRSLRAIIENNIVALAQTRVAAAVSSLKQKEIHAGDTNDKRDVSLLLRARVMETKAGLKGATGAPLLTAKTISPVKRLHAKDNDSPLKRPIATEANAPDASRGSVLIESPKYPDTYAIGEARGALRLAPIRRLGGNGFGAAAVAAVSPLQRNAFHEFRSIIQNTVVSLRETQHIGVSRRTLLHVPEKNEGMHGDYENRVFVNSVAKHERQVKRDASIASRITRVDDSPQKYMQRFFIKDKNPFIINGMNGMNRVFENYSSGLRRTLFRNTDSKWADVSGKKMGGEPFVITAAAPAVDWFRGLSRPSGPRLGQNGTSRDVQAADSARKIDLVHNGNPMQVVKAAPGDRTPDAMRLEIAKQLQLPHEGASETMAVTAANKVDGVTIRKIADKIYDMLEQRMEREKDWKG